MKKLFLFVLPLFLGTVALSQQIYVYNHLSCDVKVQLHAHDASCTLGPSCSVISTPFTVPAYSDIKWLDVTGLNSGSPTYPGIVWQFMAVTSCSAGGCGMLDYVCGWDGAFVLPTSGCSSGGAFVGESSCISTALSASYSCCSASTVTWYDDGSGNITVTIE